MALQLIKIEHDPEHGLSVNDKRLQEVPDFLAEIAKKHELNLYEMISMLIDIISVQAAGADYDAADTKGQHMLRFAASMLGECYNNCMLGFAEGAIETSKAPQSGFGAN